MRSLTIWGLAAALLGGSAHAEGVLTQPDWLHRPSAADLRSVWPIEALKKGQGGRAVIACLVSDQGVLYDCKVVEETPAGAGFGAAALLMAPQFVMRPMTRDGVPVKGGTIRIPIVFKGGGEMLGSEHPMVSPTMAWERAPTRAEVVAAYPAKAKAAAVGGMVSLQCGFSYLRTLNDCRTLAEEPKGYGLEAAARQLASRFVAAPQRPGGKAISQAVVQIAIAFDPDLATAADKVGRPNWVGLPSDETLDRVFADLPAEVKTVQVVLNCTVEQGGGLSGCGAVAEEPPGHGFAARALALVPEFRLSTWSMEGLPVVGGQVSIPIRYTGPTVGDAANGPP
jgi:TonB family protein